MKSQHIKTPTGKSAKIGKRTTSLPFLPNEKYKGDALLQKTYTENYLEHSIVKKNNGQIPQYYVENNHPAIIERHVGTGSSRTEKTRSIGCTVFFI